MRIEVRVRPGASRSRVGGRYGGSLVVAVTARAVDGQATAACLAAVAEAFAVSRRRVRLLSGANSRTKVIDVEIDESDGAATLDRLLGPG